MQRSLVTSVIFSIITCGIYGIYWFITITDEVNSLSKKPGETSGGIAFLLSLVTCGIYGIYWAYQMGQKTKIMKIERGEIPSDDSIVYLLLSLFGLSIVVYALIQKEINITLAKGTLNLDSRK